jgi:hypothetical protein
MNIFVLDTNPKKCAEYHCDKHLVKMITEHNQILGSIAYTARGVNRKKDITSDFIEGFVGFPRSREGRPHPYGIGFQNHPCTTWARECQENYAWLCELTLEMCKEYTKRYGRKHAGEAICQWYYKNAPFLPVYGKMTPFAQAMPDSCKNENAVVAYRNYYIKHKARFAKWAHSPKPNWFIED